MHGELVILDCILMVIHIEDNLFLDYYLDLMLMWHISLDCWRPMWPNDFLYGVHGWRVRLLAWEDDPLGRGALEILE